MTTALFCTIVVITNAMGSVAVDTHGARVEGIRVENIRADSALCVYQLSGDPRLPVKNVTLKNIHVGTCLQESLAENVEGLVVHDVQPVDSHSGRKK